MMKTIMEKMGGFVLISLLSFTLHATADLRISHTKMQKYTGQTLLVTCMDEAGREISWTGPQGPLSKSTKPVVQVSESLGTSVVFMPISKNDAGNYTCKAGKEVKVFQLILEEPIVFRDTSPKLETREHEDVLIKCEASGKPLITWSIEGGELDRKRHIQLGDGLLVKNVTREDDRTYICKATRSSTGEMKDQEIRLIVHFKPSAHDPESWNSREDVWGFVGGEVNLTCEIDGNPLPEFKWYKNRKHLPAKNVVTEPGISTLRVAVDDESAFGNYTCKASNKLGDLQKHFHLRKGLQPSPPDEVVVVAENANTLCLKISGPNTTDLPEIMLPQHYSIKHRPTLEEEEEQNRKNISWGYEDFKIEPEGRYCLLNLDDDTEYEIRVATKNKAGLSNFMNSTYVRTMKRSAAATSKTTILPFIGLIHYVLNEVYILIN